MRRRRDHEDGVTRGGTISASPARQQGQRLFVKATRGMYAGGAGPYLNSVDGMSMGEGNETEIVRELVSVAIVGLGYVGLPTALAFSSSSIGVTGIDADPARLSAIRARQVDLIASDRALLEDALARPDFYLTDNPAALTGADAVLICVPTPVDAHLSPDLRALSGACQTVVEHARAGQTIILTSTTYVGTTREMLVEPLADRGLIAGPDVSVAFSPERIDPGNTHHVHQKVPRVVGGTTPACTTRASDILVHLCSDVHVVSSPETAEMTKLYENIFRAVNIALANEIGDVAGALDIDPMEIIEAASTKPYGFMPFYPGPGVGGHCIPCDPHYLRWQLRALREESPLIDQAMNSIARRPRRVVRRIGEVLSDRGIALSGSRILVYGISYKPRVADTRESPAIEIIEQLVGRGARVAYYDPMVRSVELRGGVADSLGSPEGEWDLVLAHTAHSDADLEWLGERMNVLDATYRLPRTAGIAVV